MRSIRIEAHGSGDPRFARIFDAETNEELTSVSAIDLFIDAKTSVGTALLTHLDSKKFAAGEIEVAHLVALTSEGGVK